MQQMSAFGRKRTFGTATAAPDHHPPVAPSGATMRRSFSSRRSGRKLAVIDLPDAQVRFRLEADIQEGQADIAFVDRITAVRSLITPDVLACNVQKRPASAGQSINYDGTFCFR